MRLVEHAEARPASLRDEALAAARAGCANLTRRQERDGSWRGDYGGPMFLLPMYVLVARFAEHEIPAERRESMARHLLSVANSDGSVGLYAGGPGRVFTTALTYTALRYLGLSESDPALVAMARWVREQGTPLRAAPWGRFTLALVDLYDWEGLDPITPELWLLPYAVPVHPGRMWCHARQVYLPMAWLYGRRVRRAADHVTRSIREALYGQAWPSIEWAKHRETIAPCDAYRPPTPWLRGAMRALGAWERVVPDVLRTHALGEALHHVRYEDDVTNYIRIGPVNAVLNTAVHAARGDREAVARSFAALDGYLWTEDGRTSMQGYNSSQLWDTAFALQAMRAAPCAREFHSTITRAHEYVRENQILDDVPEAARHYRHASRGGWPFSDRPHGWPITDCTAEGLRCALALEHEVARPVPEALLDASVRLLLSFQNDDGAWATYERQRAGRWMEALNPSGVFGDIMVDTSHVECTSAALQSLVAARGRFPGRHDRAIERALSRGERFLRANQRTDGSWEGSWAVCFSYGTWFGVSGLRALGAPPNDPALRRAVGFLLARQRRDGSWGEAPASCWERRWIDTPTGQAVMTAWALLALVRAGEARHASCARAAAWLVRAQERDGSWARESIAGVFNRTCMINYDNYRLYFPVWALGEWLRAT